MASVRPRYIPTPYQDASQAGRLILRDGSTATIRVSQAGDKDAMKDFFSALSAESKRHRFFALIAPSDPLIQSFCDSSNPRVRLTLVVTRLFGAATRIIVAGTYAARDQTTAEIAMAVDDAFHGKGIGTLLLERLALMAVANGFRRFWAVTMAENKPMLDLFRASGFECHSRIGDGCVEIDLSVLASETSVAKADWRDRVATNASLHPFFRPRSVAVVGASRNRNSIGTRILNAIIGAGFKGPVYPVNPKADAVASLRAYAGVNALPETPDLVVIAVPSDAVGGVVDECAARQVRAVIVITAGFAEVGPEGRARQQQLLEKIRGYGMRMIGPNCLGLLNTDPAVLLNASFAPEFPPAGDVAFCSQSGALGLAMIALARERGLGLSSFVSVGNKADISGNDLLQYWEEDERTKVILLYLESFGNPRRFARIAQRVSRTKPIVAVKAGRTGAGRRAAGSHTAALAADDVAVDALFHQTGVIRADTLDEMFDLAAALSHQPLPPGRRVAILTNAGGLGILCADACEANGLMVQELGETTRRRLREFLPATASVTNPVDMIASAGADDFRRAVEILLGGAEVDALIVLTIHVGLAEISAIARNVRSGVSNAQAKGGKSKPVLTCIMGGEKKAPAAAKSGAARLPNYAFPENAARVLGKLARYADWRDQPEGIIPDFDVAAEIGFPVALKLASRTIVHKTEIGGVRLNLTDQAAVKQAFAAIQQRLADDNQLGEMEGVLVQPMISRGVEVMVGVAQDPLFGPLIGFGLGGIHVEILKDVSFRVTPITDRDAAEMVRSIKGYRLLEGYRGHAPADVAAIEDLLLRVARLVEEVPAIAELDMNPVIALPPGSGCRIVDARIRLAG